jgi:REP element-mobilizing transposase RayT
VADHVHIAICLSRTIAIAELVEKVKIASSKWLKTQAPELAAFAWQRGYGVFSLGPADLPALMAYIDDQPQRHGARTFQQEYLAILESHGVDYDERYVWD